MPKGEKCMHVRSFCANNLFKARGGAVVAMDVGAGIVYSGEASIK